MWSRRHHTHLDQLESTGIMVACHVQRHVCWYELFLSFSNTLNALVLEAVALNEATLEVHRLGLVMLDKVVEV